MSDALVFEKWLREHYNPKNAVPSIGMPSHLIIDITECPHKIPLLYATTAEGRAALRSHNAKVGVFDEDG